MKETKERLEHEYANHDETENGLKEQISKMNTELAGKKSQKDEIQKEFNEKQNEEEMSILGEEGLGEIYKTLHFESENFFSIQWNHIQDKEN